MLPLVIMRKPKVICIGIMAMLSSGGGLLIAYYLPIWFQVVQGTTPTVGGVHFLPMIGAMVFGTVAAGALGMLIAQLLLLQRRSHLTLISISDWLFHTFRHPWLRSRFNRWRTPDHPDSRLFRSKMGRIPDTTWPRSRARIATRYHRHSSSSSTRHASRRQRICHVYQPPWQHTVYFVRSNAVHKSAEVGSYPLCACC